MCLNSFLKASKGNYRISKSRTFHNVGAAYTKDISKNELAHVLLIGGTHNKQGSKDARVLIVVLLTFSLIKRGKPIPNRMCREEMSWDDPLEGELYQSWTAWTSELEDIENVTIRRD